MNAPSPAAEEPAPEAGTDAEQSSEGRWDAARYAQARARLFRGLEAADQAAVEGYQLGGLRHRVICVANAHTAAIVRATAIAFALNDDAALAKLAAVADEYLDEHWDTYSPRGKCAGGSSTDDEPLFEGGSVGGSRAQFGRTLLVAIHDFVSDAFSHEEVDVDCVAQQLAHAVLAFVDTHGLSIVSDFP